MCESKRVSLINSKNAWHKLFTHRLKTPSEKSQNRTKRDDAVSRFFSYTRSQSVNEEKLFDFRCVPNWNVFPFFLTLSSTMQQEIMVLSKIGLSFSINPSSSLQAVSHSLCVWMQWHFCFLFALAFFLHQNLSITIHLRCVTTLSTANPTLFFIECFLFLFGSWSMNRQARSQHIFLSQQF